MQLRCTPDHPVFTQRGWVNAEELTVDDFVAVVRELPTGSMTVPESHAALLGYALSEGSLGYPGHFYLFSSAVDEIEDMARVLAAFPNTVARVEHRRTGKASSVRPVRADREMPPGAVTFLFDECGLQWLGALEKRVPALVDRWDQRSLAVLVAKLFQGDGCIHEKTRSIFYATSSQGLAEDVRRLLLKLGLSATIHTKSFSYRGGRRQGFTVNLLGGRAMFARFRTAVGAHLLVQKRQALERLADSSEGWPRLLARGTVDVVPKEIYLEPLREAVLKAFPSLRAGYRALGISGGLLFADRRKRGIRRDTLAFLAQRLDSPALAALTETPTAWSRARSFSLEGEEATYDFEVPGAASFLANGMAVHNSHGACYGLVAYQTAYLKANHPVEFMAALLTSEMEKTDKIVQYMEECRSMGLRVEPPAVGVSGARFTVLGDTIHFGLAAIKNVGTTAIESITKAREAGAFAGLADFCGRVDLRLVNRRVVESLIKAGAFDSLGDTRAGLLSGLDQAMEAGQRSQRDREEGQGSLFESLTSPRTDASAPVPRPDSQVAEWPREELLAYEKDVLGFYLSGHPLDEFREVAGRLGAVSAAELATLPVASRVLLLGLVSALQENSTKSGNRMAFATLELVDGSVPLTIFPEPYRACAVALRDRGPVLVRGRIDDSDKGRVVLTEEVKPLDEPTVAQVRAGGERAAGPGNGAASLESAQTCRIRVRAGVAEAPALLASVRGICEAHPGPTPLFVHVLLDEQEVVVRAKGLSVLADDALLGKVEGVLGPGSILVEYAGRA
jgi:DNA polymerase-3 subunit alpha